MKPKKYAVLYTDPTSVSRIFSENHDLHSMYRLTILHTSWITTKCKMKKIDLCQKLLQSKNADGKIKRLSFLFEMLKQCMVICNVKHTNKQITYTDVFFL